MIHQFWDALHNPIVVWQIVVAGVSGVCCAILGCFLVLRRMSLLGDAISHSILPGIVLAYLGAGRLAPAAIFLGAMAMGILTAALTQALHAKARVPEDSSMGIVFTALFSLGVILLAKFAEKIHLDVDCALYGILDAVGIDVVNVLGYEIPRTLVTLIPALLASILFTGFLWKELKLVCFDPALATSMGISATIVHYSLLTMVAGATVASFEAVGSVLVIAMLIVPAATAQLLVERLWTLLICSALIALVAAFCGCLLAAAMNNSASGMMALVAGGEFLLALVFAPRQGLLSKAINTSLLALRIVREDLIGFLYRNEEHAALNHLDVGVAKRDCIGRAHRRFLTRVALAQLFGRKEIQSSTSGLLYLTPKGRQDAQSLVRAHRLWESYLGEQFALPLDHLHDAAERIEHYLGPQLQETLAAELAGDRVDPHGKPIPPSSLPAQKESPG